MCTSTGHLGRPRTARCSRDRSRRTTSTCCAPAFARVARSAPRISWGLSSESWADAPPLVAEGVPAKKKKGSDPFSASFSALQDADLGAREVLLSAEKHQHVAGLDRGARPGVHLARALSANGGHLYAQP